MKVEMDIQELVRKKISRNLRTCFISGIIFGWITHFYMLTHKLPNWDDLNQINGLGLTKQIGRWMLEPLQNIGQKASNPAIHGMLVILFISISACIVVSTLELKSTMSAILVPAVMVTFPSLAGTMFFMFTVHIYALGILLFCLSAYCATRYKYGFIVSGVCAVLGLAIYQPYVSIAISLMIIRLILDTVNGDKVREIFIRGVKCAATLAVSTGIYIMISHLIYPNMEDETYGGVNEMGKIAVSEIPINFGRVYKRVLEYFIIRPFAYISHGMRILNICICVLLAVMIVTVLISRKLYKEKTRVLLGSIALFLFPFALGFVYFMAPDAPFSTLMIYSYSMLYVLAIALAETTGSKMEHEREFGKNPRQIFKIWIPMLSCILIGFVSYSSYLIDSQAYFRSSIAMERANNFYNRLVMRVEETPGYQRGDRVAILGEHYYVDNPSEIEIPIFDDDEGFRELSGVALENGLITSGVRSGYMITYTGFNPGRVSDDEKNAILESDIYKKMPIYPEADSVAQINDIWVVKLSE